MPPTFRAAVVTAPGTPEPVTFVDRPQTPVPPGHVRVGVEAAAVNPVDLAVVAGIFHQVGVVTQPEHTGLGWDFAGPVLEAGEGVDLAPGTVVAGFALGIDRDYSAYAEQITVPVGFVAVVPDGLSAAEAATVPLNGLTAAQLVAKLGPGEGRDLLVTGAAGAVGAYVVPLAIEQGWNVTGLARATDEAYVRSLGAEFTTDPAAGWPVVIDAAALQEKAVALVADGGRFLGVQPSFVPAPERGIDIGSLNVAADAAVLADLLHRTAAGRPAARVARTLPLERWADAHAALAAGGSRGRQVLVP